jgi:hypothetical protein
MKPSNREHAIKSTTAAIAGHAQRTAHRNEGGKEINSKLPVALVSSRAMIGATAVAGHQRKR